MDILYRKKRINWAVTIEEIQQRMPITKKELAKLLHVRVKTIYKWEQGVKHPYTRLYGDIVWLHRIAMFKTIWRRIILTLNAFFKPIFKSLYKFFKNIYLRLAKKIDKHGQFVLF